MSQTTIPSDQENPAHHTMSREDALGTLVAHEIGMHMVLCRVIGVETADAPSDDDTTERRFTLKQIHSGETRTAYPDRHPPNIFMPDIDAEFAIYERQHQKGNGDWVATTPPRRNPLIAAEYFGEYTGHENTRIRKRAAIYRGNNDYDLIETTIDDPKAEFQN
ncbi:hypothetical protein [Salinibaculum rarum]|uniref:hypothetical protein n=1 Tax=Salinibaculum rarum TaxID=3058903 RepID=UPI00265FE918|nr:hypothetical protein [Salinibaculum sp. KK48]